MNSNIFDFDTYFDKRNVSGSYESKGPVAVVKGDRNIECYVAMEETLPKDFTNILYDAISGIVNPEPEKKSQSVFEAIKEIKDITRTYRDIVLSDADIDILEIKGNRRTVFHLTLGYEKRQYDKPFVRKDVFEASEKFIYRLKCYDFLKDFFVPETHYCCNFAAVPFYCVGDNIYRPYLVIDKEYIPESFDNEGEPNDKNNIELLENAFGVEIDTAEIKRVKSHNHLVLGLKCPKTANGNGGKDSDKVLEFVERIEDKIMKELGLNN